MNNTRRLLADKLELYQAILFAIVGLIAEGIIGYIVHKSDLSLKWKIAVVGALLIPLILICVWFLKRLTNLHVKLANRLLRLRIAMFLTAKDWLRIVGKWYGYVSQGNSPAFSKIRAAIGKEYLEQELMDLSGESDKVLRKFNLLPEEERLRRNPEGRPLIFTSFVRYSALVKAMVNTALAEQNTNENSIVICITTLSMSLQKWLNFDDKAQSVHTEWEGYLAFLRSELRTLPNVVLTRILLVKEPHRVNNRVNLRSIPELDEELRNWVWLTKKGPDYSEFAAANVLEPLAAEKKLRILTEMKEHYTPQSQEYRSIAEIRAQTSPNRYSYLILPRTQFPNCPTNMDGGEFVELGTAFISTYHTKQEDGNYHSYYSVVEPSAYVPDPQTDDPPFPLDLFYVAKVRLPNGQPIRTHDLGRLPREPLFCLAARPDEELHMVYLYLLDPQRCPRNFTNIDRYITLHLQTPRLLSDYRMGTLT